MPEGVAANAVALYPNPSNGLVQLTSAEAATVQVFSATGQLVKEVRVQPHTSTQLELGSANGIYLVRVPSASGVVVKRLEILR